MQVEPSKRLDFQQAAAQIKTYKFTPGNGTLLHPLRLLRRRMSRLHDPRGASWSETGHVRRKLHLQREETGRGLSRLCGERAPPLLVRFLRSVRCGEALPPVRAQGTKGTPNPLFPLKVMLMFESQYNDEMEAEVQRLEARQRALAAGRPEWANACAACGGELHLVAAATCDRCRQDR